MTIPADPVLALADPDALRDPGPAYAALRVHHPVYWHDGLATLLVSRYADGVTVLRDNTRFGSDFRRAGEEMPPAAISVQTLDPPEHTGIRHLLVDAVRELDWAAVERDIQHEASARLADLSRLPYFDFVSDFAEPLAWSTILAVLGVPGPPLSSFGPVADAIVDGMDAGVWPELGEPAMAARAELSALAATWLDQQSDRDHNDPAYTGIVAFTRAHAERRGVPRFVLNNTLRVLAHAGYTSASKILSLGAVALLSEPDALGRFAAADPGPAVEELVRYCSPVRALARVCVAGTTLGGYRLKAGDVVTVLTGAANRDPARFTGPDSLRLDRSPNPHLGFGRGAHSCLGSSLAALQARLVFGALARGYPAARLAAAPVFRHNLTLRGLRTAAVTLRGEQEVALCVTGTNRSLTARVLTARPDGIAAFADAGAAMSPTAPGARRIPMRIVLVTMPWHQLDTPCLPLGLLRARLDACRLPQRVTDYYGNLAWAEHLCDAGLTLDDYAHVADWGVWHAMGEWIFASALYDDPDWGAGGYLGLLAERGVAAGRAPRMRELARAFADLAASQILDLEPDLVGFTTTFQQNVASLAVAKRLKQARPELITVFGGGNCHGPMGPALHRNFGFLDHVVNGEAEVAFVALVDALEQGAPLDGIGGLTWRQPDGGSRYNGPAAMVPMHLVPRPDYSAWQVALDASPVRGQIRPVLVYEAARGCWWGEKHHCTFCGLNGTTMKFRAKPAGQVFADLEHLIRAHQILDVVTVDNILDPGYLRDLIPRLQRADWDVLIRYEVKANLRGDQLAALRDAGIRHLQPGLESLSSPVLRLMDKGVHATQNIQVLRDAEDNELTIDWNWLYGFPGEQPADYERVIGQVPALVHLQPPTGVTRILLERFSPNFERPELGFAVRRPARMYDYVYDVPAGELVDLCYQFESPPRGIGGGTEQALRSACQAWQRDYRDSYLVRHDTEGGLRGGSLREEGLCLSDARAGWARREHLFADPAVACVYDLLSRPRTPGTLAGLAGEAGYRIDDRQVADLLRAWQADGLVFADDGRVVALATRTEPLRAGEPPDAMEPLRAGS